MLNYHNKYFGSIKFEAVTYHYGNNCKKHDVVDAMIKRPNDSFRKLLAYFSNTPVSFL